MQMNAGSVPIEHDTIGQSVAGSLTVRNMELRTETGLRNQASLKFYVQNPRIYSIVHRDGHVLSQEEIEEKLLGLEHVRELIVDIKRNGGLIDPLIVKPETLEVLEGNSRLAAYRQLAKENPIKWSAVKCTTLPLGLDDSTIFALLGQYHIKGKKNWAPFEQAGFLFRRSHEHHIPIDQLAREIGLSFGEAKLYIETFSFMRAHDDNSERWSYYYEYLKSRKIKKARENITDFDEIIVAKIQANEISKAVEIRDLLPKIAAGPPKILEKFVRGALTFDDAIDKIIEVGADSNAVKRLNRFRQWLVGAEFKEALAESTPEERKRIEFELNKIYDKSRIILKKS